MWWERARPDGVHDLTGPSTPRPMIQPVPSCQPVPVAPAGLVLVTGTLA